MLSSLVLICGMAVLLFVWIPGPPFRLEQFDLPKDFVLGVIGAICAATLALWQERRPWEPFLDASLAALLSWGTALSCVVSKDGHQAWHALGIFAAATCIYLLARQVAASADVEWLLLALCLIVGVFATVVLLEAWGGLPFISTFGRRPGGTIGNRNLAARVTCLTLPLLWRQLVLTRPRALRCLLAILVMISIAVIVLSRSRGSLIVATALVAALPVAGWWLSGADDRREHKVCSTSRLWLAAVSIGVSTAVFIPNRMGWRPTEFADSARRVLDYSSGTGLGRVIQAQVTWRMIQSAPLLGVGPGRWSVLYPAFSRAGDPSVNFGAFYPGPQVPRNDALGFVAEYGTVGLVLGLLFVGALTHHALRMLRCSAALTRQSGLLILAIGTAALALGLFDSVVRVAPTIALIALFVGLMPGVNYSGDPCTKKTRHRLDLGLRALLAAYGFAGILLARGALQDLACLRILNSARTVGDLYRAVAVSPSNSEARILLALALVGARRCDLAKPHIAQAALLEPLSEVVGDLRVRCNTSAGRSLP